MGGIGVVMVGHRAVGSNRLRRTRRMAGVVLVVSLITTGLSVTQQLATAQGAGASTLGNSIVSIVESQDQSGADIVNDPASTADGGCNPYTGYWGDGESGT